jgi:hypothetical protein
VRDSSDSSKFFASPYRAGAVVALVSFGIYLVTLAPGVTFIDSGELAAVACTLGIAHPTGYPLFTLLGWLFSNLPIPGSGIFRLNVMAALLCALGIFVFFQVCMQTLALIGEKTARGERGQARSLLAAAGGSLILAFSETWWSQATAVEVYSLHVLFLSLVLYSFLRAYSVHQTAAGDEAAEQRAGKLWLVFAFLTGLAFTNHMTTVLLAPGLIFLFFATYRFTRRAFVLVARMSLPFLVGASLYLYLPIRASRSPLFNWGDPITFERFLSHLRGKQYSVWIFSSAETASRQFGYFVTSLPGEFAFVGLVIALVGCVVLLRRSPRMFAATLLLFLSCVAYSINYDIHDIDSYFLLAYISVAVWSCVGILGILKWKALSGLSFRSLGAVLLVISVIPLFIHFRNRDESRNHLVEDYTMNVLNSIDRNGIVISYQWDYWVSASYYFQYVEGVRPDLTVIDKELVRRSWYLRELTGRFPWLIRNSKREVDAFLVELVKFERGEPYDPRVIQARFEELILSFLVNNPDRPLYVTGEIEPEFTRGFERVPVGLVFRLEKSGDFKSTAFPDLKYRPFERTGRLENGVRRLYADALTARGIYHLVKGNDRAEARKSFSRALSFDPSAENPRLWLKRLGE